MTLVVTNNINRETDMIIPVFMIIQSDRIDKLGIIKHKTNVHIRTLQLYREVIERVNKDKTKYHTIESFKNYVYNDREQLQILTTI
jgi:hypothetical protein